ncbi:MAG: Crp/Fnr family transcriptional regulator [Kofleriaceae bacterium]|nr:Crp/Fnr family transcriptional regulator [Kofleriaceae bacterium]MBP6841609.1 Crp/Fnr family transcriptional regulator [Kofleriaceae bacterium]MBP9206044.1 Crp/Fnr family transcriptional regulator [Kofleriaceae bacterium]
MTDVKRVVWYLRKIALFADLGGETLARLAEKVEMREVRRREVVYLPGDPGTSLFVVNGGRVKISKVTRDGKSLTLAYCGPSELFGETCLIDGGPRAEMAEAVENALLTEIERADFERLVAATPSLGLAMTKLMVSRRRDLENKVEALVFRDVTSKLAELLVKLALEFGVDDARGTMVALKITHQELANLIGSTRETVSLTLSQFKRKNLITTEGRKVIIADAEALRALF